MDLTRSITSKSASEKAAAKKLAFSVENILDPTKFCSSQEKFNSRHWPNGFESDERLDDDQSESQSGGFLIYILKSKYCFIAYFVIIYSHIHRIDAISRTHEKP